MEQKLKVAILIVSTTAAKNPSTDASSSILNELLEKEGGDKWEVVATNIVGDIIPEIQSQILAWTDTYTCPHLIITTGGTGFATSDLTPEVRASQDQELQ